MLALHNADSGQEVMAPECALKGHALCYQVFLLWAEDGFRK